MSGNPQLWACRACGAQPGETCIGAFSYHAERIEDANAMETNVAPVSAKEFDEAVEDTGLV